jgi:hypothetical protein
VLFLTEVIKCKAVAMEKVISNDAVILKVHGRV